MPARKVILVIVEGSSDDTALHKLFDEHFNENEVYVDIIRGDITNTKGRELILNKVGKEIKRYIENNKFKKSDFQEIIHIIDTDGAFVPDSFVIEDLSALDPIYSPTEIRTSQKAYMENRNKIKKFNLIKLSNIKKIYEIKYSAYYMSCNLDHVLYDKLNLTDKQKEIEASNFIKKYRYDIKAFENFITKSGFAVVSDYKSSWAFIAKENNSLNRYSNLGLCFITNE